MEVREDEVVKALEWMRDCKCEKISNCDGCPLHKHYPYCDELSAEIALDIINRQKAEIERYREVVGKLAVAEDGTVTGFVNGKETKFIDKEVAETFKSFAVSGARKEFAERVKGLLSLNVRVSNEDYLEITEDIENLLEEMEGLECETD